MKDAAERLYLRMLVLRCQAGDEAALSELVARYSPRVRFFLRKLAGDEAADDLLQDTWFDVVRKLNRLKDADAFVAWLYRIARDRAWRELRRRRVAFVALDESSAGQAAAVEEEFGPEDAQLVRAAMDELVPEHREALVLRFVEQMSYEEIADVANCPVGTVRSRIFNAKRALRTIIQNSTIQ